MDKELKNYLNEILASIIDEVVEMAYDLLIDTLNQTIYQPQPSDAQYERTYEFRDKAWIKKTKGILSEYIGELYFDGMKMSPQSYNVNSGYSHGNLEKGIDRRKDMASILDDWRRNDLESDWAKAPGAYWVPEEGYWDKFIDAFEAELDKICMKKFKQYGLKVEKVG